LYLDGVLQGEPITVEGAHRKSSQPFLIGANPERFVRGRPGHVMKSFSGMIDEVRISSTARYTKDFEPEKRHGVDPETMLLYHFDEGVGTVAVDSSGNGHDGEIAGGKWIKGVSD
jgi:hypothetical protein